MRQPYDHMETHDNLRVRYGIWSSARDICRGATVVLGGRTEFMEKYSETIGELQGRGFDVISLDWRGQGLSKRQLGDRLKGFVATYEDYLLDLHRLMERVVLPREYPHLGLLGHSMGGHIALRYLHDHPDDFQSAVLVSPMFDIIPSSRVNTAVRWLTRMAVHAGMGRRYAAGTHRYRSYDETFHGNRLTSDPRRFRFAHQATIENPDLAVGGVTYGWLSATFRSIDLIGRPGFAEAIPTPSQIVCAELEQIVSIDAQYEICRRLQNCALTVIPGARHEILMERDPIRNKFWEIFDGLLERHPGTMG
ncbi:Lysophospholipase L2 (EC [Olavius algarvensis associated proteobacterium Delta 3]|nr:Lysophospholipase L2 (EC [Olavius algarvensis associated proteobacterium Delta 3]